MNRSEIGEMIKNKQIKLSKFFYLKNLSRSKCSDIN